MLRIALTSRLRGWGKRYIPRLRWVALLALLSSCSECRKENPPAPVVGRSWKTPPLEQVDAGLAAVKFPRVLYRGGAFLRNPRVITVTFKNEDPAIVTNLEKFSDTITKTPWWRTVVDSYCASANDCIGEGSSGGHLHVDEAVIGTVRDMKVEDVIEKAVASRKIDIADPNTVVIAFLPAGVTLADAFNPKYCSGGARAYHRAFQLGERRLPYAVVPRCGDEAETTATASHELLESTTNPDPGNRGFAFEPGSKYLAFTASGLEPVDACGLITRDTHRAMESGFHVQRAWSNREAALGRDPCVPSQADKPYVALVPAQPIVRLSTEGDSVTVPLEGFASHSVPEWSVAAVDVTGDQDHVGYVDLKLDKTHIEHGESANLSITLRKKTARDVTIVGLVSTLGEQTHMWPLAVSIR
jgi:hypothetical protein